MGWKDNLKRTFARLPDRAIGSVSRARLLVTAPTHYRRKVRRWCALLRETQYWSEDRLQAFQLRQLKALIQHAYINVPYYRGLFDEIGAKSEDFRELTDLRKLPLLTKSDLQDHLEDLIAVNYPPKRRVYATTGGSTGIPVGFYLDKIASTAVEWAFIITLWHRVGYREEDSCAVLRGDVVSHGGLWEINPFGNLLIMSSYHLTDDRIPLYVERLRQFQPRYIQAYPSAISILARFIVDHNQPPLKNLEAVLCGSENLYPSQRQLIEQALQCRVFSWYGQSEKVCLAGECEFDPRYHIFPEYGVTELLDECGRPIEAPGQIGEIVGTGFLSRSMPLLRYRTMDMAVYAEGLCGRCGRKYRLLERVEGRLQEYIVTGTGRYVLMAAINMHSDVFDNVRQFQLYQDTPGQVIFKVVPKESYGERDAVYIHRELRTKLGTDTQLAIQLVDSIPRTPRGKYRFLDQRLPNVVQPNSVGLNG